MSVLILSPDPVAAALLGAFVESLGRRVVFGSPDEADRELLRRLRPGLVLLDCTLDRELCDSVLGPATMMGSRVVLFAADEFEATVRDLANHRGVEHVTLPRHIDWLGEMIASASEHRRQAL